MEEDQGWTWDSRYRDQLSQRDREIGSDEAGYPTSRLLYGCCRENWFCNQLVNKCNDNGMLHVQVSPKHIEQS